MYIVICGCVYIYGYVCDVYVCVVVYVSVGEIGIAGRDKENCDEMKKVADCLL
jgi:hypothetical protein